MLEINTCKINLKQFCISVLYYIIVIKNLNPRQKRYIKISFCKSVMSLMLCIICEIADAFQGLKKKTKKKKKNNYLHFLLIHQD